MVFLPAGLVWREHGRLAWSARCTSVVPCSNDRLLKQHLRSRTHRKRVCNVLSIHQQSEQPLPSAAKQHINSATIAPEDFQQNHLEALHLAGTHPRDDHFASLYYTVPSCAGATSPCELSTDEHTAQVQQPRSTYSVTKDDDTLGQKLHGCQLDAATQQTSSSATSLTSTEQQQQEHWHPCWPLPFAVTPKTALATGVAFITPQSGSIPSVPDKLEEALQHYCQPGTCLLPDIRIQIAGRNLVVKSWEHAAHLLRAAAAGGYGFYTTRPSANQQTAHCSDSDNHATEACGYVHAAAGARLNSGATPFWASFVADISHPSWWPETGHVPKYDNVIIGAGPTGIGIHHDADASDTPQPVSTYLTIFRGKKHVIVMPPDQTLFPVDDELPFPVGPTPELVHAVKAAGGAYFDLQPTPNGAPVTMYMPAGWLHWLIGASDWHVVCVGSLYTTGTAEHSSKQWWSPPPWMIQGNTRQ